MGKKEIKFKVKVKTPPKSKEAHVKIIVKAQPKQKYHEIFRRELKDSYNIKVQYDNRDPITFIDLTIELPHIVKRENPNDERNWGIINKTIEDLKRRIKIFLSHFGIEN